MNTKKTVLFVAPYFPPHSGGLERYLYEVATRFDIEKWQPVVLTTSETGSRVVEDVKGVTVYRLPIGMTVSNTPFSFTWFLEVRKILKEVSPDLINVHMPVPGLGDIVALLKKRSTPLVVTYHGNSMKKGRFMVDALIWLYESAPLRFLLSRAEHIVCASDTIREGFLKRYTRKTSTITPGVDTGHFTPDSAKKENNRILFVAGLGTGEEHKGLDTLLHALVVLKKTVSQVELVVVGKGDKKEWYEERAHALGLKMQVRFAGYLSGQDLVDEYQKAAVFALPTENESFGMVIAEAMAAGLPVVSTRVGGVPLLVEHDKTGLLVEPKSVKQLAKALSTLLKDQDKMEAFGTEGREAVLDRYSWEERVHAYQQLFEHTLSQESTIAHIVGYYPPHLGGMEVVAQELAVEESRCGKDVRVYTSNIGAKRYPHILQAGNCTVYRLRSLEVAHTPILWTLPARLLTLPKRSVLHVHLAQVGIPEVALLASRMRGFPVVFHFHLDVEPSGILGPLFLLYKKYVLGFVLRRGSRVVVFSEEQKQFVVSRYGVSGDMVRIIPNGVGEEYFNRKTSRETQGLLKLLYVGRLSVQKRVDRLIPIMKQLKGVATLTVVGEGEDRKQLERSAKDERLDNITFVGRKSPEEVRSYHKKADAFITTSDKEGMPLSVLEAMAAGLPVIASDVLGLRELVGDTGVLVSPQTTEAFVLAVKELYEDDAKRKTLEKRSIERAEQFTWKKVAGQCMDMYDEIV